MDSVAESKSSETSKRKGSKGGNKKGRKRKVETGEVVAGDLNQQEQQSSDTIYSCITLDEKKRLLNVIKTKGFGIIYTPELLLDEFPGRSKNEISFMIENYKRKGKEFANKLKMSADIDINEKAGTEQWYSLIHNLVPHLSKRDDLSDLLTELFYEYSQECIVTRPQGQANYDQIYEYLADVLGGKYPRDLNAFDSLIILSLLEKLRDYCETFEIQEEEEFMKSGSWWAKPSDKLQEVNQDDSSMNTIDKSGSQLVRKYFESCLDYPKIRKIRHCLNPLNVPVKMLRDEHEKVSKLLDSLQTTQD